MRHKAGNLGAPYICAIYLNKKKLKINCISNFKEYHKHTNHTAVQDIKYLLVFIYQTKLHKNQQTAHVGISIIYIFPKSQLNHGFSCEYESVWGNFYKLGSSWQLPFCSVVVSTVPGILTGNLPVWTFSALLKLVTDWSLVLCETSLRTEDGILNLFFFCCICTV